MNINSRTLDKLSFAGVDLMPGDNRVDNKAWPALAKNAGFQKAVDEGVVVIPEGLTVKKPKTENVVAGPDASAADASKNTPTN